MTFSYCLNLICSELSVSKSVTKIKYDKASNRAVYKVKAKIKLTNRAKTVNSTLRGPDGKLHKKTPATGGGFF
jgi:hypothetical protein